MQPHSAVALGGIVPDTPRKLEAGASAGAGGATGDEAPIAATISLAGHPTPSSPPSAAKAEADSKRADEGTTAAGVSESKEGKEGESVEATEEGKVAEDDARAAEPAGHNDAKG